MRCFNTTGPCIPELHYMVPPIPRLPKAKGLVERGLYFVVHAPRQVGKTTTLRALAEELTADGELSALHLRVGEERRVGVDPLQRDRSLQDRGLRAAGTRIDVPLDQRTLETLRTPGYVD